MVLNTGDKQECRLALRRQTVLTIQPDDVLVFLSPSSRLPASHMDGSYVWSLFDSLTHLDACHLLLGLVSSIFRFVKLGDILGNS